ncbi:MAG: hypothetical protein ACRDHZ_12165 [Ktedonobacteraceae bacterium]
MDHLTIDPDDDRDTQIKKSVETADPSGPDFDGVAGHLGRECRLVRVSFQPVEAFAGQDNTRMRQADDFLGK